MRNLDQVPDSKPPAVQLWFAYPSSLLDASVAARCADLLSGDEGKRAARLRFDRHRREYLATHALVRTALAHNHPLAPADWRFRDNSHGKPAPDPDCGLRFNLSNAQDLVACAIARGAEVGVDLEPCRRGQEILNLAPRVFSPQEQLQLENLPPVERPNRALSLWVLKEAYIKARGLGLALPLGKFSFLFGGAEDIQLFIDPSLEDQPARWRFCLLDHAAHRIALTVESAACMSAQLEIREARPPFGPGARQSSEQETWFPR